MLPSGSGHPVRQSYGSRRLNASTDVASTVMAGRRLPARALHGPKMTGFGPTQPIKVMEISARPGE